MSTAAMRCVQTDHSEGSSRTGSSRTGRSGSYLFVVVGDVDVVPVVEVERPPVVVLQRCPHQQVAEAVVVEVGRGGQGVAKPGVLKPDPRPQGPIQYKHPLLEEQEEEEEEEQEQEEE